MLKALVKELVMLENIKLTIFLDGRFNFLSFPESINCIYISASESFAKMLPLLIEQHDAVWPVAPESDSVLYDLSVLVEEKAVQLLNSSSTAVAICADKLLTAGRLKSEGIEGVNTVLLSKFSQQFLPPWVVKPKAAEGCEGTVFVANQTALNQLRRLLAVPADYIIQPYIDGQLLSLSCLFKGGKAWLLCCNRQNVSIHNNKFSLQSCEVNISEENNQIYQNLINQIASVISGLWGYVGIDIIHPQFSEPLVLEINPRLTTSYVGINQALGVNVAEQVVAMVSDDPVINKTLNQSFKVSIV